MEGSLTKLSNHEIMEEEYSEEETTKSSSSCNSSDDLCLYLPLSTPSTSDDDQYHQGPLFEMSSLISVLPFKRGLSKHYEGKSESFTSLSNVGSLEDLAKPERPDHLKKSCRSCAGGIVLDIHKSVVLLSSSTSSASSRSSAAISKINNNSNNQILMNNMSRASSLKKKKYMSRASLIHNNSLRSS